MTNELPAGRELDAAVARAMGYHVELFDEDEQCDGFPHGYLYHPNGDFAGMLNHYSEPKNEFDKVALLGCVIWLVKRMAGIKIIMDDNTALIFDQFGHRGASSGFVDDSMAAFALAICRAVVKAQP